MNFEDWFKTQDFYLNMLFTHGDNLFNKDGNVYRITTVNMIKLAFDYCGNTFEKVKAVGECIHEPIECWLVVECAKCGKML